MNRKTLPNFGVLPHLKFDIEKIRAHCHSEGLFNFDLYNDIKVSSNSAQTPFVQVNAFNKKSFFTEDDAAYLEGESYKQLYLTEIRSELLSDPIDLSQNSSPGQRQRRLDPKSPTYNPVADELNYTRRNSYCKGALKEILDSFQDQVTRVRLAYLAPHFAIKPHVDYDPSYITRYHIPIMTNPECYMKVFRSEKAYETHFVADGSVYFLNAGLKHCAENRSDFPRLHLIVDVHGLKDLEHVQSYGT